MKIKKVLPIIMVVVMAIALVMVGCGNAGGGGAGSASGGDKVTIHPQTGEQIKFAVVAHAVNSFTIKLENGAKAAAADMGVKMDYFAPTSIDVPAQMALAENALSAGYDGIAYVNLDSGAAQPIVDKAHELGIPVVAFNSDPLPSINDATIQQDSYAAGYELGQYVFDQMGGQGVVQIISGIPTLQSLIFRANGFKDAAKDYPGISFAMNGELLESTTDMNQAVGVVENVIAANPDITCIFSTDYFGESIGMVLQAQNLQDKIYGCAFDITDGIMGFIKSGHMKATMGQNPFLQGYYPIVVMTLNITENLQMSNVDTKGLMCTTENVDWWISIGGE